MSKGLALTLLIAIVFLVTIVAEEGGPLDTFTGGTPSQPTSEAASASSNAASVSPVSQASSRPTNSWDDSISNSSAVSGWAGESSIAPMAPSPSIQQPRSQTPRNTSVHPGALPPGRVVLE